MTHLTRLRGSACALVAAAAMVASSLPGARASEPKGDLNLELRVVEIVPAQGASGSAPTAIARIEAVVDAFAATHDLELTIERPDGAPWTTKGRPVPLRQPSWTSPAGEPVSPGALGVAVPARGTLRALIEVPLEGAAVHEIIVRARGVAARGPVQTESMVKAALGVVPDLPVDDGATASFKLQEVR